MELDSQRKFGLFAFLTGLGAMLLCGCAHTRVVVTADVPDYGETIQTKYRYYCVMASEYSDWLEGSDGNFYDKNKTMYHWFPRGFVCTLQGLNSYLAACLPEVFSEDGIPIVLESNPDGTDYGKGDTATAIFTFFLCEVSGGILPCLMGNGEAENSFRVWLAELPDQTMREFSIHVQNRMAVSVTSPIGLMCYRHTPVSKDTQSEKVFVSHAWITPSDLKIAFPYALAARLREMEEAGVITDRNIQISKELRAFRVVEGKAGLPDAPASETAVQPYFASPKSNYTLESLEWNDQKDFECDFSMILNDNFTMKDYSVVMQDIIVFLRDTYIQMHPGTNANSLVVDARPSLKNGRIIGHAAVLS
ncbi:MAG: hypothetical protein IJJ33_17255, partial [Victivallales bacterium]|nr:hypothetical protein [Victivallales bacterium]